MINFILGFSICLNLLLFLVLFYLLRMNNKEENVELPDRLRRKGVFFYGRKDKEDENFKDVDRDFYGNDF